MPGAWLPAQGQVCSSTDRHPAPPQIGCIRPECLRFRIRPLFQLPHRCGIAMASHHSAVATLAEVLFVFSSKTSRLQSWSFRSHNCRKLVFSLLKY